MNVKKHCPKCGFPFMYMNDACFCTDASGNDMIKLKEKMLGFEGFEPFKLKLSKKNIWNSENILDFQKDFKDFMVDVVDRVEEKCFTIKCSVRAMSFIERNSFHYSWIKAGLGKLIIAGCEVLLEVDFTLAGNTMVYEIVDQKTEQTLHRIVIAE